MTAPLISDAIDEMENRFGNRYDLVMIAAKRAKEIQQGSAPLIRTNSTNPLTIALEEIEAGVYPPPEGSASPQPPKAGFGKQEALVSKQESAKRQNPLEESSTEEELEESDNE
ncbi:MAG: DNA-directed RNA polymerase subunit omega [Armatimonadota bacterium]